MRIVKKLNIIPIATKKDQHKDIPVLLQIDFSARFNALLAKLDKVQDLSVVIIYANRKARPIVGAISNTRSQYIGVSKNGCQWQSLITIKKRKMYISNHIIEKHAALAFDFYSILANGLKAVTNFRYTKDILIEMLRIYKENGDNFMIKVNDHPTLATFMAEP